MQTQVEETEPTTLFDTSPMDFDLGAPGLNADLDLSNFMASTILASEAEVPSMISSPFRSPAKEKSKRPFKPRDEMDRMFINALKGAEIPLERIQKGKYMFGSRIVNAKILHEKLFIHVGGGYMSAQDFVAKYGQVEI